MSACPLPPQQDLDAFLAGVDWAQTRTIRLDLESDFPIPLARTLRALLSHPQSAISNLHLIKRTRRNVMGMDEVFALLLEPCSGKLRGIDFHNPAMCVYDMQCLQDLARQRCNITKLSLALDWSNLPVVLSLAPILTSPGNSVQHLGLRDAGLQSQNWLLPREIVEAISSIHCVLTSLEMDSGTFLLDKVNEALILQTGLCAIECSIVDDPCGLNFWGNILQARENKLHTLVVTGPQQQQQQEEICYATEHFCNALAKPACRLSRLLLTDMHFTSLRVSSITSLTELRLRAIDMPNASWLEFMHSLPLYFTRLAELEISSTFEFDDECGLCLANWLKGQNCKLRGIVDLNHTALHARAANRLIQALRHPNCSVQNFIFSPLEFDPGFPNARLERTVHCMCIARLCLAMMQPATARVRQQGISSALRRLPPELFRLVATCLV